MGDQQAGRGRRKKKPKESSDVFSTGLNINTRNLRSRARRRPNIKEAEHSLEKQEESLKIQEESWKEQEHEHQHSLNQQEVNGKSPVENNNSILAETFRRKLFISRSTSPRTPDNHNITREGSHLPDVVDSTYRHYQREKSNDSQISYNTQDWVTKDRGAKVTSESGFSEDSYDSGRFVPGEQFFGAWDYSLVPEDQQGWDTPRKIAASTRRLSLQQPSNPYIAYTSEEELHRWWEGDRTDYTYSASLSYRALSPRKRVGSPNMARRPLHGAVPNTNDTPTSQGVPSPSYLQQYYDDRQNRSSYVLTDSEDETGAMATSALSSRLLGADTVDQATTTSYTSSTTVSKSIRYGLDYESDGDDFNVASVMRSSKRLVKHRATPVIASATGGTSASFLSGAVGAFSSLLGQTPINNSTTSASLLARDTLMNNNITTAYSVNQHSRTSSSYYCSNSGDGENDVNVGIFGTVASVVKGSIRGIVNTPRILRETFSFGNGDRYDTNSSDTFQKDNNNAHSVLNASVVHSGDLDESAAMRSRGGSGIKTAGESTSPMLLRSRRRVGKSTEESEQQQVEEESEAFQNKTAFQQHRVEQQEHYRSDEQYDTNKHHFINNVYSTSLAPKQQGIFSYILTLLALFAATIVRVVTSSASFTATKVSNSNQQLQRLARMAVFTVTNTFSKKAVGSSVNDNSGMTYQKYLATDVPAQNLEREVSITVATKKAGWFSALLSGLLGKKLRRRRRRTLGKHSMNTRSKSRSNHINTSGIDPGLKSMADDITEHDYGYDRDSEDGDSIYDEDEYYYTITTVVTTVIESFYDACFGLEELGRRVVGANSRRNKREMLKRMRLESSGYFDDVDHASEYDFNGAHSSEVSSSGVRRKQADINIGVGYADINEKQQDDGVVGGYWWLLPLLLLFALFAVIAGWSYLLGSEDLTTSFSTSLSTIAITVTSTATRAYDATAYVGSPVMASLSYAGKTVVSVIDDTGSVLYEGITSAFVWCYSLLTSCLMGVGNVISSAFYFVLYPFIGATEGKSTADASPISSAFLTVTGGVSEAIKSGNSGIVSVASSSWVNVLWLLSSAADGVVAAAGAVSSSMWFVVDLVWFAVLWLLSWLWWSLSGLGYLVGGAGSWLVILIGGTANRTIEAVSSAKMAVVPIFRGSSHDAITASLITAGGVGGAASPTIDELVARLLDSKQLHQQLGSAVSSEVSAQTAPTAAQMTKLQQDTAAAQQQTAQLLQNLQQHHNDLKLQLEQLATSLSRVETGSSDGREALSLNVKEQREQQQQKLDDIHATLHAMNEQIQAIQEEQTVLSAEVKSCCRRSLLTLADVDKHVKTLIASLIRYTPAPGEEENINESGPSMSVLSAWMSTYFVAKAEMERQVGELTLELEKSIAAAAVTTDEASAGTGFSTLDAATLEQTQQLVMDAVTQQLQDKLQAKIKQDLHSELQENLKADLQTQIDNKLSAKFESTEFAEELNSKLKYHVESQVKTHVEEELKPALKSELVAQLHSNISLTVKSQVEDEVQSQLNIELPAKLDATLKEKAENIRTQLYLELDSRDAKLRSDIDERVHDEVVIAVEETLPGAVEATVTAISSNTQPGVLNATVQAIVADAIAAHMGISNFGSCNTKSTFSSSYEGNLVLADTGEASDHPSASSLLQAAVNIAGAATGLNINSSFNSGRGHSTLLSQSEVELIVAAALKKYDADRTGLVDHALESAGGAVVSTRCTEAYEINQAQWSWLGIPFYSYSTNTPRSLLQPDRNPGQCWAFKGSQGYVVIRLVAPVSPTGFSLEHIPRDVAPFGDIDSAPKNFSVWGLNYAEKDEGVHLGSYMYRADGEALQYFHAQNNNIDEYYPFIELKINSNHGNMKYTCLYRFRVHGIRMRL